MKFSTCFLFSLQNATRRKLVLLLFWIEIIVILSSFLMTKGVVNYYQGEWEAISGFSGDSLLLLGSYHNHQYPEEEMDAIMKEDPNITAYGYARTLSSFTLDDYEYSIQVYALDDLLWKRCHVSLSKGIQLTDQKPEDGVIPVIVGTRTAELYQYGGVYDINYAGPMKIRVVGVLSDTNAFFSFSGGGINVIYLPGMIQRDPDAMLFVTSHLADQPIARAVDFRSITGSTALVEVQDTGEAALTATCEKLQRVGDSQKAWEVQETSMKDLAAAIAPHLFKLLIVLIACLVGIYGYNLYKQTDNLRKNSICYLCGATNRDFVRMQLMEAVITLLPPLLVGTAYGCSQVLSRIEQGRDYLVFRPGDPFQALWILLLIYLISYLPYVIKTVKSHPIDMIRRFE